MFPKLKRAGASLLCIFAAGCAATDETGRTAMEISKPAAMPARALTGFRSALFCMDDMLMQAQVSDIPIGIINIPDPTEQVKAGATDMLVSALSDMSRKSEALAVRPLIIRDGRAIISTAREFPAFLISGAVTQMDKGVVRQDGSVGIGLGEASLGGNISRNADIISLDMHGLYGRNRAYISGLSSSNAIAVQRTARGGSVGASLLAVNMRFQFQFEESEGNHQALRTLIQLGAIETIGKLTGLPYQTCLALASTDPARRKKAFEAYDSLSGEERRNAVGRLLRKRGYLRYRNPDDAQLGFAILNFERDKDLLPDGRIDFDVYFALQEPAARSGDARIPEGSVLYREFARLGLLNTLRGHAKERQERLTRERALVFRIQNLLRSLGLREAAPTGVYDGETKSEIAAFSAKFGGAQVGPPTEALAARIKAALKGGESIDSPKQVLPKRPTRFR